MNKKQENKMATKEKKEVLGMTLEQVVKRKEDLENQLKEHLGIKQKVLAALEENRDNLSSLKGALADCEFWIQGLTPAEEKPMGMSPVIEEQMEVVD
jgi:hypothetical protein